MHEKMSVKFINGIKKSVCKVQGVNRTYNFDIPYNLHEEYECGGTAFFVDPKAFGDKFTIKRNCRYLLTNFHVVQNFISKQCILEWPERNRSYLMAEVKYVAPNLDVAILELDVGLPQVKWWTGDHIQWLEGIKNCPLNTKDIIKGASQQITAIGFPNLCSDYQISNGSLSSRGLGMLSCDLSINSGNSGGPLFYKNKVIGICTATISDSERLSLAVPIQEIFRFFNFFCLFKKQILRLPSWGFTLKNLTTDYLDFKGIDRAFKGVLIKDIIEKSPADKCGLKKGDILMGIDTVDHKGDVIKYSIDTFGQTAFASTDKRVRIDCVEYMLNLDPSTLCLHYFRKKKIHKVPITIQPIDFKVRTRYPAYEDLSYTVFGGLVFTGFHLNMLEGDEDEEEESEVIFDHGVLNTLKTSYGMESMVILTHIPPQSYTSLSTGLQENDQIVKINNTKIRSIDHLLTVLDRIAKDYYGIKSTKSNFITVTTTNDEHVLSIPQLSEAERHMNRQLKDTVVLRLLKQKKERKRKRRS
ncbi:MAG: hypothetical protein CMO44_13825 [Verrucomicrobiales bacterium]|nr:hypothetical protein [Verrucomicrobiales bacterium]|tara:strand:- start:1266 stop:2846 length:1581 start_codon:yes stop_codon:yes gene_type:complete